MLVEDGEMRPASIADEVLVKVVDGSFDFLRQTPHVDPSASAVNVQLWRTEARDHLGRRTIEETFPVNSAPDRLIDYF